MSTILVENGRFPPGKPGDRTDRYREMIGAHGGRIIHIFDTMCKCACGFEEHDEEECQVASCYAWICRRCGRCIREY